jgi:flagellar hook-associated protein 1 FlgK
MSSISGIMNSALSALTTQQAAINITNSNIANVDTDGYSRRQVTIESTEYGGVEVSNAERTYDAFLLKQIVSETQELGKWEAEAKYLKSVEAVFDESEGSGMSEAMSEFWNAWQDLVDDPSGSTERSTLASVADTLAQTFNSISSDLSDIQEGIDDDIVTTVSTINRIVEQIADLNEAIARADAAGQDTSTFQDSLDSLVTQLSSLIDISSYENKNGQICVQTANGKPLVEGTTTWSLSTEINSTTGLQDVTWVDSDGNYVITDDISGGKLGGCLEIRDERIPVWQDQLDELAVTLMDEVNALQTSGYDINGGAGVAFFTGTGASDMALNTDILDDPGTIAAASSADGAPGEGSNASAIAELQNSLLFDSGTSSFSDFYATLVSEVGTAVQAAQSGYESRRDMLEFCTNQRESVSGVSLDEEMAKLIVYQNAYEAAAKIISVLDELMETILNM